MLLNIFKELFPAHLSSGVAVLVCIWLMFHFTLFVPDPQTRYDLAWYFLFLVAAIFLLNVVHLLLFITFKVIGGIKTYITKRNAKIMMKQRIHKRQMAQAQSHTQQMLIQDGKDSGELRL